MSKIDLVSELEKGNMSIDEVLNYIDKMISVDIDEASFMLDEIRRVTGLSNNPITNYLANRISEIEKFSKLGFVDRREYNKCLKQGRKLFSIGEVDKAFGVYSYAFDVTGMPIFKYYMGKCLYYKGADAQAIPYFYDYLDTGSENVLKANLYLWSIAKKRNYPLEHIYRFGIIWHLPKIIDSVEGFSDLYEKFESEPSRNLVLPSVSIDRNRELVCDCGHFITPMTEVVAEDERLDDFYNFSFEEQVQLVRDVYSIGDLWNGDKLLKMLETGVGSNRQRRKIINGEKNKRHVYEKMVRKNINVGDIDG